MKILPIPLFLIVLFTLSIQSKPVFSQGFRDSSLIRLEIQNSKNSLYEITTISGSSIYGKIIERYPDRIVVTTKDLGTITVQINNISILEKIKPTAEKAGEYWFTNPNSTRYLIGPSAINLKRGEGYYQNIYLVGNTFNYAFSDHVTLGGGFEITSLFQGNPIYLFQSKVSTHITGKFYTGGGILLAGISGENGNFGVVYGVGTYGDEDDNITLGIGYGYEDFELVNKPILTLGAMCRLSKGFGLVTENWLVQKYGVVSYGIRFMGKKMTVDLAFLNNADIADFFVIGMPFIDFVVKF
ncbi:MAG: hypothetical protein NTW49_07915 [Bacteroidia bacterium]|nr:hypothetical protein [Bacteroidia bacterium]